MDPDVLIAVIGIGGIAHRRTDGVVVVPSDTLGP
jgi:ketopantoate hydroxymethyltransferase